MLESDFRGHPDATFAYRQSHFPAPSLVMNLSDDIFGRLPQGTVIALHDQGLLFCLSWKSQRGLHIVRSCIPQQITTDGASPLTLAAAIEKFNAAILFEMAGADSCGGES